MKNFWLKFKDIPKSTIGRVITLVLAIANEAVAVIGASTFCSTPWYPIVSTIVLAAVAIWTAWENNDFSYFASIATELFNALNDGKLSQEELDEILTIITKKPEPKDPETK